MAAESRTPARPLCSPHPCDASSCISVHAAPKQTSHVISVLLLSLGLSVSLSVCLSPPCFTLQNLHQLKQIQTLKQMNEQLQAENRALARVVARLSASMEASETQEL